MIESLLFGGNKKFSYFNALLIYHQISKADESDVGNARVSLCDESLLCREKYGT